jgi:hypothetical protein
MFGQLISEIPAGNIFTPEFSQVESEEYGIVLYDQYADFNASPNIRKTSDGNPLDGKKEDYSSNNLLIHKGYYQDGKLRNYTNYFQNESIERQYKYKTEGTGDLIIFYLNGYTKSVQKYANHEAYHWEDYYENGQLAYVESKNKKSGIPQLIQENSYKGTLVSSIEISDNKALKYIQTINFPNGNISEQGELTFIEELADFRKDGRWVTYNTKQQVTSEIIYLKGEFKEVLVDNRPDSEKDYLKLNAVADNEEVSNDVNIASKVPANIIRFDKDGNGEISNKEIDMAVNEFFEDDSITKSQINDLVNFFFEQD